MARPKAAPTTGQSLICSDWPARCSNNVGWRCIAEAGLPVKELCRKQGFSDAPSYTWRAKFGGMAVSEAKRLKEMEQENARLKKLLAESMLDQEAFPAANNMGNLLIFNKNGVIG